MIDSLKIKNTTKEHNPKDQSLDTMLYMHDVGEFGHASETERSVAFYAMFVTSQVNIGVYLRNFIIALSTVEKLTYEKLSMKQLIKLLQGKINITSEFLKIKKPKWATENPEKVEGAVWNIFSWKQFVSTSSSNLTQGYTRRCTESFQKKSFEELSARSCVARHKLQDKGVLFLQSEFFNIILKGKLNNKF